jgi:hypothetical protein
MSKQYDHPKVFKQVRADGIEYFFAEVVGRGKWFFGMLTSKNKSFVCMSDSGPYLFYSDMMQHTFKSFSEALSAALIAIEKEKVSEMHSKIVSYQEVENTKL